jgi:hypothetical protein
MIEREYFDEHSALRKVGKHVQTTVAFSGVPRNTKGIVVRADIVCRRKMPHGEIIELFDLAIQWNLPDRYTPLLDWFSQDEYERFLVEVEPEI